MKARQILQLIAILALFVWGGMFIYLYASGRMDGKTAQVQMVTDGFQTFALIAGIGLCVLGAFNLLTLRQKTGCGHDHDHEHGENCGHDHSHEDHDHDHEMPASNLLAAVAIMVVPLLLAAKVSKEQFSQEYVKKLVKIELHAQQKRFESGKQKLAEAPNPKFSIVPVDGPKETPAEDTTAGSALPETPADETTSATAAADTPPETDPTDSPEDNGDEWGEFTMKDLKRMVPQNEAGSFLLDVPQIFYTAGDEELMKVMEGIPIETIAQVMPETINNEAGTRLRIFRLFIECCAADARPLSIPIEFGKAPPEYEEMGWIKVVGKMHYSEEGEEVVPLIIVESMEKTAEPVDMMMY